MGLKSFIYTSYVSGEELVTQSAGLPNDIANSYGAIYSAYLKTDSIDGLIKSNPDLDINEYCPVKKQYSKIYGGKYFLKGSYIGREIYNPERFNNIFFHGGFTSDNVSLPFSLFDKLLLSKMSNVVEPYYKDWFPELQIPEYDYTQLIKNVSDFITEDKLAKLSNYLEKVIYAIDVNKHHLCFYNCGNGKELWEWIRCFSMILPSNYIENCTFDTHINPHENYGNFPPLHHTFTEKILGYLYNDGSVFERILTQPNTYTIVNLSDECAPCVSLYEGLKVFLSGDYEEISKKVKIYRSIIDFCQGNCIEQITKAIKFTEIAYSLNSEELASNYIELIKVILTAKKFPKDNSLLNVLLQNSIKTDAKITYDLINEIASYPTIKNSLNTAINNLLSNDECVSIISDSVFNNDGYGLELVKAICDFDAKSKLNAILSKNIDTHIEKFLNGDENAINLHSFLSTYISDYKKSFNNLVKENYNKNKDGFIENLLSESSEETINTLKLYSEYCSSISVGDLFKIASEKLLNEDKIAIEVLEGNINSFKTLNDCLDSTGDKKKEDKIEKYIKKTLYSSEFLNSGNIILAIETLKEIGLENVIDNREIIKTILKFKSYEKNISCLDFIVDTFKNLDEVSRVKQQNEFSKQIYDIFLCDLNRTEMNFNNIKTCFDKYPTINSDLKLKTAIKNIVDSDNCENLLNDVSDYLYKSPFDTISFFNSLLENRDKLSTVYFNSYISKKLTVSAYTSYLLKAEGDISEIVAEHFDKIWKYIAVGGIATVKEVLPISIELISKVNDETKELFVKSLILNYGLYAFDSVTVRKITRYYENQLPFMTVITVYSEVVKTNSLPLSTYNNMSSQLSALDKDLALQIEQIFQSAISFDCVMGKISTKIIPDLNACFDITRFYRDMLSHFTKRNDGSVINKNILKFLEGDFNIDIKDFASKYVTDNDILSKLAVRRDMTSSKEMIIFNNVDFFKTVLIRHSIDSLNIVKVYINFCKNNLRGNDDALFTLVLLNGNLRGLDENTASTLNKLSSSCASNIYFHLSTLNSFLCGASKVTYNNNFDSDPLKNHFAWLTSYESLTRKTEEKTLKLLVESYKEEYINALCEIMTEPNKRLGKLNNLQFVYNFVTKNTSYLNSFVSDEVKSKLSNLASLHSCIFAK